MVTFPIPTKVLYFPKAKVKYYDLFLILCDKFNGLTEITVDEVDSFLESIDQKFYIKELSYQLELYNVQSECVFCINKPIK